MAKLRSAIHEKFGIIAILGDSLLLLLLLRASNEVLDLITESAH